MSSKDNNEPDEYVSVRVSTLKGDVPLTFNTYVRVAGKYILYSQQGQPIEQKRLDKLREKKLKKVYIKSEHEGIYRSFLTSKIDEAYSNSPNRPIEQRANIIHGAQQAVVEDILEHPESQEYYEVAQESIRRYVDFISNESESVRNLLAIANSEGSIAHHSVNVATLSIAMAIQLGQSDNAETLAMGCLLHDLGHVITGLDVNRPIESMNETERSLYFKHPLLAVEKIRNIEHINPAVSKIILQHEESIDGSGFPAGLTEKKIDPLALIVITANTYDRFVSFEGMSANEAIKKLVIEKVGVQSLDMLNALKETLKSRSVL